MHAEDLIDCLGDPNRFGEGWPLVRQALEAIAKLPSELREIRATLGAIHITLIEGQEP